MPTDSPDELLPIIGALQTAGYRASIEAVGGGFYATHVYTDYTHTAWISITPGDEPGTWAAYYYDDGNYDGQELGHTLTTAQVVKLVREKA
jgi:hypothetical protein